MKLRNNIFAAALDYLKRNTDIKTQKELARRMGVTENTITRILRDYTEVTEDIITKLQTASGCIFNLQWLRGEDSEHMLAVDVVETPKESQPVIDQSSMVNASLSAYIQLTNRLTDDLKKKEIEMQERLAEKDARIAELKNTISDKDTIIKDREARIVALERQLAAAATSDLDNYPFSVGVADDGPHPNVSPKQ
jgi:transcriptional regulator with XRE-family HTH domain